MNDSSATPAVRIARLTPPGRGAVATIAVTGEASLLDTFFRSRNGRTILDQPLNAIRFGVWVGEDGGDEDVVVCRVADDCVEIHCHGGDAAVERIHNCLAKVAGEPPVERPCAPVEELLSEGRAALSRATTQRTSLLLARQLELLPAAFVALNDATSTDRRRLLDDMLRYSDFGLRLTSPRRVAVCGRPNVGKSSLVNRLLGFERAIVSAVAGTTRDVLRATTAFHGWPIELIDTAGQRMTHDPLESAGISQAAGAIQSADVVVLVYDAALGWTQADADLSRSSGASILVANKVDLVADRGSVHGAALPVSAISGAGIEHLLEILIDRMFGDLPPKEQAYPVTVRQLQMLESLRT